MFAKNKGLIKFHYQHEPFHFPQRSRLKVFVAGLFKKEGHAVGAVNYIFCTDAYLLDLNQAYLRHDTYTDIITFGLSEKSDPLIADIYISVDRVRENARLYEVSFRQELHRVIFHGALHLCGYKDKSARDVRLMRSKENFYLQAYFVSRGTQEA